MRNILIAVIAALNIGCVSTASISSQINDPLILKVELSTKDYDAPVMNRVNVATAQDIYFRAYYNKQTKITTYQLYIIIQSYNDFQDWNQFIFLDEKGNREALSATRVHYDYDGSYGVPAYFEDVVVSLTEQQMNMFSKSDKRIKVISKRSTATKDIIVEAKESQLMLQRVKEVTLANI